MPTPHTSRHMLTCDDAHGCTDDSPELERATMHATCMGLSVHRARTGQYVVQGSEAQVTKFRAWLSQQRNTALSLGDLSGPQW